MWILFKMLNFDPKYRSDFSDLSNYMKKLIEELKKESLIIP